MKVMVEGAITSIEVKTKDDKPITEILLAQQGEREQVKVRLDGDRSDDFDLFQMESFSGRLMLWSQRNGVGSLVMA
jgi:hypothetical protein